MNISKTFALCFFSTIFAFAQQLPLDEKNAPANPESFTPPASVEVPSTIPAVAEAPPVPPPPPPPPSPVVEAKPEAPEGKTIFDSVRGHAYNPYSTVGAASTVGDLVLTPSDINGQKFFYVSPTSHLGYAAFPIGSSTAMLGLDNSRLGSPAALILGYANSVFGIALNYSVAKTWEDSSGSASDVSQRNTHLGDNIGLYFSLPLGAATLYANAGWLTYGDSYDREVGGNEIKLDFSEIQASVGLMGSSGSLSYDGYLNVIRTGGKLEANDDKYVDEYTYLGTALHLNIGYAALQNSNARVIVGANNYYSMRFYDKIEGPPKYKSENIIGAVIAPNILGEVSLTDSWLAFAGATHTLNLIAGDRDDNTPSYLKIAHADETDAFVGLRYQKTNWAVEAQVSKNPFVGFNGDNMFAEFGGFVYF